MSSAGWLYISIAVAWAILIFLALALYIGNHASESQRRFDRNNHGQ